MSDTLTTTAETLNVREGAGANHPIITQLPKGTRVQRLESANDWFRIQTADGRTGWISARFAQADGGAAPAPAPAVTRLRVTATTLNLREGPDKSAAVRTQLPHSLVVEQLERSADGAWVRVRTSKGTEGWVSASFVEVDDGKNPHGASDADPKWYQIAWNERGQAETPGNSDNPRIIESQKSCPHDKLDEDVPWCSFFANWVLQKADLKGSGSAAARSWLKWGEELQKPRRGCVVVLSRPGAPSNGHVAFYVGDQGDNFLLLGGNQGNQVSVKPYAKSRLLGFRWPKGVA
jgi:uncharacterized protein (TIGR02594 family)